MNPRFFFSRSPASGFPHVTQGQRESEVRDLWLPRSERILDTIVATGSSIVCLQECWLSHPEWVRLFDSSLGAAGYRTLKLPRTNNRGDGESEGTSTKPGNPDFDGLVDCVPAGLLAVVSRAKWFTPALRLPNLLFPSALLFPGLMIAVKSDQWHVVDYHQQLLVEEQLLFRDCLMIAVKQDQWHVVDYQQLLFHDCGDRVAQIVRLRSKGRLGGRARREGSEGAEGEEEDVLVVNTHLLFPHDANSNIIRLCQVGRAGEEEEWGKVYKLLERVEQCRTEQAGRPAPVILCGSHSPHVPFAVPMLALSHALEFFNRPEWIQGGQRVQAAAISVSLLTCSLDPLSLMHSFPSFPPCLPPSQRSERHQRGQRVQAAALAGLLSHARRASLTCSQGFSHMLAGLLSHARRASLTCSQGFSHMLAGLLSHARRASLTCSQGFSHMLAGLLSHARRASLSHASPLSFSCTSFRVTRLFALSFPPISDLNGTKEGNVYKLLRSQGFLSSYDTAHHLNDVDETVGDMDYMVADVVEKVASSPVYDTTSMWVSHRSHRGDVCGVDYVWMLLRAAIAATEGTCAEWTIHRGDVCGVDYVWMLNARTPMSNPILNWRKAVFGLIKVSWHRPNPVLNWRKAVFALIKSKLLAAGITDARHAFQFFATAGDTSPFEHTVCFTSDPNATDAADVSMDFGQQQNDDPATEEEEVVEEEEEEEDEEAWRYYDSDEEGMERQECCITAFTIEDFQLAVAQLGLTGDNSIGLTEVEVAELMQGADTDGDGWVDFNEFQDMFQQPTWDSRVDTLKQSMAASLAASLAAASAAAAASPASTASASAPAAAAGAAAVSASAAASAASPSAASSQEQQKQRRWEEKEQAVLQGEQPYWESRRGLNVEGEAGQGSNRCRDANGAGAVAVGVGVDGDAAGADAAKEMAGAAGARVLSGVQAGDTQGADGVEECEIEGSNGGLSLAVLKASLFPPEMEEGRWPEDYTLSDHAVLTVMFGRERVDEVSK
ncbi:unnamed protein product [Closterium sp. NIES-64]|nr:unnamed protein product [Closterium sp. NIES-64]